MADIAVILSPDGSVGDIGVNAAGTDLAVDSTLLTAVILSLFLDRVADPGDTLMDGTVPADKRGWAGDAYLPPRATGAPDHLGSKLWLRQRALATPATAALLAGDCQDALAWMEEDGIADQVTVTTAWQDADTLGITVAIMRAGQATQYDFAWNATFAQPIGLS